MLWREQKFGLMAVSLGLGLAVALAFALTLPYSSLGSGNIVDTGAENVIATRFFIVVLFAPLLAVASVRREAGAIDHACKKFALTIVIGLSVFVAMNGASYLCRGGATALGIGFPFEFWHKDALNGPDLYDTALWADIVVAVFVSASSASVHLRLVKRLSPLIRLALSFSFAAIVYVGVFTYWWTTSKTEEAVENGVRLSAVEVHQSELMYLTQPMWEPAFCFMERVRGYRYVGYIAAMEDSAFCFEK